MTTKRYLHIKSGGTYEVLSTTARFQASSYDEIEKEFEHILFTIYRNVNSDMVFIRPTKEFFDGRFKECQ